MIYINLFCRLFLFSMNCILGYPDILGDRPNMGSLSSGMKTTLFAPNLLHPILPWLHQPLPIYWTRN